MILFKDEERMRRVSKMPLPYMNVGGGFVNLSEISIHGSRRVEILKLWLSLQHLGLKGYAQLVEEGCRLAKYLFEKLPEHSYLRLAGEPEMNIICFRGEPDWIPPASWDDWNTSLQGRLLSESRIFLSLPTYRGARWLRCVLLNPYTDEAILDRTLGLIDAFSTSTRRRSSVLS